MNELEEVYLELEYTYIKSPSMKFCYLLGWKLLKAGISFIILGYCYLPTLVEGKENNNE
jgi:hypothetical protein